MKKVLFISILLIGGLVANAQCNKKLVEKAKSELNNDEILLNDFKIELKEADIDNPAPIAKFSQKLEEGKKYRIRILSDKEEYNSWAILRLFENNKLLATNHIVATNKYYESFEFKCTKTGNYKLLITFHDGKAGCAVVIVSYLGVFKKKQ